MLAISFIYFSVLALFVVTGVAVSALLDPRGRWLTPAAPALGAASIVIAAYLVGYLFDGSAALVAILVLVVAMLAFGLRRRLAGGDGGRAGRELRAALRLSRGEASVLALGAGVGLVLLLPVYSLGFPTTLSPDIADGWVRTVLAEWLMDHPLADSAFHVASDRPVGSYSGHPPTLGAGLEYLIGISAHLLGRETYETAGPLTAAGAPVALAGWSYLHAQLTERAPALWQSLVLAAATLSPPFVLPFVENYLTQSFSLALWPFAIAAVYAFVLRRTVGTAVAAGIGCGALAGVYPPMLPWLGPPAVLLVLALATRPPRRAERLSRPWMRRAVAPVAALAALGAAVVVVAPIEVYRAYDSVIAYSERLSSNEVFPLLTPAQDLAVLLGGISQFDISPYGQQASDAHVAAVLVLLVGAVAAGLVALWRMPAGPRRAVVALGIGLVGVTLASYYRYKHGNGYGYGTFKTLVSGGALLAGVLAIVLAAERERGRAGSLLAAGVALAVWAPVSAGLLQEQHDGNEGFRDGDRQLIRAIERLPATNRVLVEGAADTETSFHMRMSAGYAASVLDRPIDGIGTTATYFTGGGSPNWRPSRPWRYVVARAAPSPFSERRRTLRQAGPFLIQDAPAVDVTPYAVSAGTTGPGSQGHRFWSASPVTAEAPADYIGGPVELVVSNRTALARRARLGLDLQALGRTRMLRIASRSDDERRERLREGQTRRVAYALDVPARSTAVIELDPGPPAINADGTIAPIVSLTRVEVA
jgi:hypothetical protein